MRRCRLIALPWALAFLLCASLAPPLIAGENEDLAFAKQLRQDGKYMEAAGEFLLFADKYPQSAFRPEALFGAGECFLQAYRAHEALEAYQRFLDAYPTDERACLARLQRGKIFKALKRYKEGADELLLIPDQYPGCALLDQALLDAAECLMSEGDSEGAELVLRRVINDRKESSVTARARYTLAIILNNTGRGREAEKELGDIISRYKTSPVRALSLILLGQRALAKNEYSKAEGFYRTVDKDFKEDPLAEKAVLGIIEIDAKKGSPEGVLAESERFLTRFPNSSQRGDVTRRAVEAALDLKRPDKAMALIDSLRAGTAAPDSTGEISILTARSLAGAGKVSEAVAELDSMRSRYPSSPLLADALVLEAELREGAGAPVEAARLYNLALAGTADTALRIRLHTRLARLSASRLADTVSAIRYWKLVSDEDRGSGAEEALFRESVLEEEIGDLPAASRGYEAIMSRFPDGKFAAEARERLRTVALLPVRNEEVTRKLARIEKGGASPAQRSVEAGVVLVEDARDAAGAIPHLEKALGMELADSSRAKASYYLGRALLMRYDRAKVRGGGDEGDLKKGINLLKGTADRYEGTVWGDRAQRDYLDRRFPEWSPAERVGKIDAYLKSHGAGPGRWWALNRKAEFLYELARAGDTTSAKTALAACDEVLADGASPEDKKEAMLLGASLRRMRGDDAGAARGFQSFVASYGDDPRVVTALYDLGETLAERKDYGGAAAAYDRCIAEAPASAVAEKCMIRKADCLLGQNMFAEAAAAYDSFSVRHPTTGLADEAIFREALAKDKIGEQGAVESELDALLGKQDVAPALRLRVIAWYGDWLLRHGRFQKARPLLEELVRADRTAANATLEGEASFGARDYAAALASFSDALAMAKVDTCRVLADRAKAYLRAKDAAKASADLALLKSRCAGSKGIAAVILERGMIEQEEGRCEDAGKTMADLRTEYPDGAESAEALYYLALCDIKRSEFKVAVERLERFLDEAPRSPLLAQAYFKLGTAEYGMKNLNLAAQNYALAAEAAKDRDLSFNAYKNLGGVQQQMEKWEDAASTWQKVIELFPERKGIIETFFDLGFCYNQAGKNELAYEVYIRIPDVAANEEQQGRAHYWAGMSLKTLGSYDEAIREFLLVPRLKTGGMWGVTSRLEAASCYEATGAVDEATKIYRDVLASFGANSDWGRVATEGLKRIEDKKGAPAAPQKTGELEKKE